MERREIERLATQVVDAAIAVHAAIGPGLLESAYDVCLGQELGLRHIDVRRQLPLDVFYKGVAVEAAYRLDMVVGGAIVLELKTISKLLPIHDAQLLSYLRLGGYKLGFLINFHVPLLKDGIRRMVNGL